MPARCATSPALKPDGPEPMMRRRRCSSVPARHRARAGVCQFTTCSAATRPSLTAFLISARPPSSPTM